MITGFLINSVYILLYNIMTVLPTTGQITFSGIEELGGFLAGLNAFLPVSTLLILLGGVVTLKSAILAARTAKWLINTIRGAGA